MSNLSCPYQFENSFEDIKNTKVSKLMTVRETLIAVRKFDFCIFCLYYNVNVFSYRFNLFFNNFFFYKYLNLCIPAYQGDHKLNVSLPIVKALIRKPKLLLSKYLYMSLLENSLIAVWWRIGYFLSSTHALCTEHFIQKNAAKKKNISIT